MIVFEVVVYLLNTDTTVVVNLDYVEVHLKIAEEVRIFLFLITALTNYESKGCQIVLLGC